MLLALLLVLMWLMLCRHPAELRVDRPRYLYRTPSFSKIRASRKPDWVRKELIRLKAHLPDFGCRKLADLFNSLYAARGMTVGKSFVYDLLKQHAYDVLLMRNLWKARIPSPLPCNHTWGLDMTGKMDLQRDTHSILGIVDHDSRLAVCLLPLRDQTTIAVLRALLDVVEHFGKPRKLRTDNGPQFCSYLFRLCLKIMGIKQQFSKPGMPWMNGRIERLFGTLKERLNRLAVADFTALELALMEFKAWYNHARPHQHLRGRTPGEAWNGVDPFKRSPLRVQYVVGWDGLLTGYYVRR
jgi:transposase InsO family protein